MNRCSIANGTIHASLPALGARAAGILAIAAAVLLPACEKDSPSGSGLTLEPRGEIVDHTGCKLAGRVSETTLDCVEWEYGAGGVLILTHVNAAFNCCIDDVAAGIAVAGDTIMIVESEIASAPCHCLCLYDVDYRVEGLAPGTYTVVVVEPYTTGDDAPLAGTIDLLSAPSGGFCVSRDHYPWMDDATPVEPQGRIVGVVECGEQLTDPPGLGAPLDMSCAEYSYAYGNTLSIRHENAGFNCCAREITADITVETGLITIVEHEDQSACDCSCLWDVYYEIVNVPPGVYRVRFVEPYLHRDDESLQFTIDLSNGPTEGVACAGRVHYPWTHGWSEAEDWRRLDMLSMGIVGYVGAAPCNGGDDCRYIAFGAKPCGGPWSYLVYSTENVDEALLERMVAWYNAMNGVLNRRYSMSSDCSIPEPPNLQCLGGRCVNIGFSPR